MTHLCRPPGPNPRYTPRETPAVHTVPAEPETLPAYTVDRFAWPQLPNQKKKRHKEKNVSKKPVEHSNSVPEYREPRISWKPPIAIGTPPCELICGCPNIDICRNPEDPMICHDYAAYMGDGFRGEVRKTRGRTPSRELYQKHFGAGEEE